MSCRQRKDTRVTLTPPARSGQPRANFAVKLEMFADISNVNLTELIVAVVTKPALFALQTAVVLAEKLPTAPRGGPPTGVPLWVTRESVTVTWNPKRDAHLFVSGNTSSAAAAIARRNILHYAKKANWTVVQLTGNTYPAEAKFITNRVAAVSSARKRTGNKPIPPSPVLLMVDNFNSMHDGTAGNVTYLPDVLNEYRKGTLTALGQILNEGHSTGTHMVIFGNPLVGNISGPVFAGLTENTNRRVAVALPTRSQ
jgi:hypothetical protein